MNPIRIEIGDIAKMHVDAVVNAANEELWQGGGVCGAIFEAAGARQLQAACDEIGWCPVGGAVITPAFKLPAKYIIHAVGPIWRDGRHGEPQELQRAYRFALELAKEHDCKTIAFPLISSGIFGYPKTQAWDVAIKTCRDFLKETGYDIKITFAVISQQAYELGQERLNK